MEQLDHVEAFRTLMQLYVTSMSSLAVWKFSGSVDVDNIYHVQNCRVFNLIDFSHLDSRDLALAVGALSFNQWFTKICSKDFKLTPDVQEQVLYMIARSCALEEVSLEASGLKMDFAVKLAGAFRDSSASAVHIINLSLNAIEDKGVIALSQSLGK
ncbi:leucine-rich repeat-containing protein 16B-like, partial [Sinocyclocheilus grahami]|uniref:leucine-rich repeat-containing protein 16B-like n=1 Tax=Sinocyclocheilus grahami TaxID=75366 RepID=UPI0007ACE612